MAEKVTLPCWRYRGTPVGFETQLCQTAAEVEALGAGWIDTPAPFLAAQAAASGTPEPAAVLSPPSSSTEAGAGPVAPASTHTHRMPFTHDPYPGGRASDEHEAGASPRKKGKR